MYQEINIVIIYPSYIMTIFISHYISYRITSDTCTRENKEINLVLYYI